MAVIRSFRRGTQSVSAHPSRVDCHYQTVLTTDGHTLLHLSTFGSDGRQVPGKSSQSFQLDRDSARELGSILSTAFEEDPPQDGHLPDLPVEPPIAGLGDLLNAFHANSVTALLEAIKAAAGLDIDLWIDGETDAGESFTPLFKMTGIRFRYPFQVREMLDELAELGQAIAAKFRAHELEDAVRREHGTSG